MLWLSTSTHTYANLYNMLESFQPCSSVHQASLHLCAKWTGSYRTARSDEAGVCSSIGLLQLSQKIYLVVVERDEKLYVGGKCEKVKQMENYRFNMRKVSEL